MTDRQAPDGPQAAAEAAPVHVRFGARDTQVLPLVTAEELLTLWFERAPASAGALLAEVMVGTGQRFTKSKSPADSNAEMAKRMAGR